MSKSPRRSSGYASLALTSLLFVLALTPVWKRFESITMPIALVVLVAAIVLGIRAVWVERGHHRLAAGVSLGVLLLWTITSFVMVVHRLRQIVAENPSR